MVNVEISMDHQIEARVVDSLHLMLKTPLSLRPGSTVMISIESSDKIAEDEEWYSISLEYLAAGYGEEEPEYNLTHLKQPNLEYHP
jgi:hypothetical protein